MRTDYPAAIRVRPPPRPPEGELSPPGSKSLTNRALLLAALADGDSRLTGCLESEDTHYMRAALTRMGARWTADDTLETVTVTGLSGPPRALAEPARPIEVGTAGTAARFLTAALAAAPLTARIDGSPRMRERPMAALLAALRSQGATIRCLGAEGFLPVELTGAPGGLAGGPLRLGRLSSSQFISALVLAGSLSRETLLITLEEGAPARPYVDMTVACVNAFGGRARWRPDQRDTLEVAPARLRGCSYAVEPDASAASYFLALAAVYGGAITIPTLGATSLQGDAAFADVLARMGARAHQTASATTVEGVGPLTGGDFDLDDMPDMTLTLAAVALHARGPTRIRGVAILRHHESDRLAAAACELRKLGAQVIEHEDGLTITPPATLRAGVAIDTYRDHRMAMAFSLAGAVTIRDPACVAKTFPRYFEELARFGMIEP
ncbi:MAG: 3-phosphoshikimate 1-carboxyvinyltransferase [Myxococcales bacterium]|nr:3-phosphoshikimate 1-carboxyvinyltransferase [Myxococcales bacterium]